jgi:hypothetical protein
MMQRRIVNGKHKERGKLIDFLQRLNGNMPVEQGVRGITVLVMMKKNLVTMLGILTTQKV